MSLITINVSANIAAITELLNAVLDRSDIIMGAISDYAVQQKAWNTRATAAIDGLGSDIAALNAKISALQNSAGTVTPEDQALLDELQRDGEALATKFEALDALTPPTVPTVPPSA